MASVVTSPEPKTRTLTQSPAVDNGRGAAGGGRRGGGGGEGGGPHGSNPGAAVERYKLGVWVGFGGIVMVFAALTSAMVVRSGLSDDWKAFDLPGVLWLSTAVLLLSSISIEKAKRAMRDGLEAGLRRWLSVTAMLGACFLATQLAGWSELADRGIYIATNPSSSFFYLLTAGHGLHLFGGLLALTYVVFRVWRATAWATKEAAIEGTVLYWHFMDGLWVYLFALLLVWR
jgi:cytochrome c oxidase subunit 3